MSEHERIRMQSICLTIATLLVITVEAQPASKTVSVCEVLTDLSSYNGRRVEISGEWVSAEEHNFLSPQDEACSVELKTGAYVWRHRIWLTPAPKSKRNEQTLSALRAEIAKVSGKEQKPVRVIVTFEGTLETRVPLEVVTYPTGSVLPYGFGHLNAYPAELEYQLVRRFKVLPASGPQTQK